MLYSCYAMTKYILLFSFACVLSMAFTPLVRWVALRLNVVDRPDARKVHQRPLPRWGGLAILSAFVLAMLFTFSPVRVVHSTWMQIPSFWWTEFLASVGIIVALGAVDDVRPLGAKLKLFVQVLAAVMVVVWGGCVITHLPLPWGGTWILHGWGTPMSVFWIVLVTNAFNLIDGLDGLASGIGIIAALTLAAAGLFGQSLELAFVGVLLAGSLLGFLRHNFHPATIFLGDSGSLFIGFTIAVLSIRTTHKGVAAAALFIPLLACGLPVGEVLLSVVRRVLRALHLWDSTRSDVHRFLFAAGRSVFTPDREHVHHRLLAMGYTHSRCVVILYAAAASLAGAALVITLFQGINIGILVVVITGAGVFLVRKLRYQELQLLHNGTLLPLFRHPLWGNETIQMLTDMLLFPAIYFAAYRLRFPMPFEGELKNSFVATAPAVLLIKLGVAMLLGIYRVKWTYAGVSDVLRVIKFGVVAAITMFVISIWVPGFVLNRGVLAIDLFLTVSLVLTSRFTLHSLEHFRVKTDTKARRAVIYGADAGGARAVQELLDNSSYRIIPVGFIDDNPNKQRKTMRGYPVLGASEQLREIIGEENVDMIIIGTDHVPTEVLARMKAASSQSGVRIHRLRTQLIEVMTCSTAATPATVPSTIASK